MRVEASFHENSARTEDKRRRSLFLPLELSGKANLDSGHSCRVDWRLARLPSLARAILARARGAGLAKV